MLKFVLDIIYTGKGKGHLSRREDIESLLKLLDLNLPGLNLAELQLEDCSTDESEVITVFDNTSSCDSSHPETKLNNSQSKVHMHEGEPNKKEEKSPEYLLIEMAKKLMPFEENKSMNCNIPGCLKMVTHLNMTSHFEQHFEDHKNKKTDQKKDEIIMFKCHQCSKEFKFRRALEHHKKKHHSTTFHSKTSTTEETNLPIKMVSLEEKDASKKKGVIYENEKTGVKGKKTEGEIKPGNNFNCGKCKKDCRTRQLLNYHLVFHHYKDKLKKAYPDNVCGICDKVLETNHHLLQHVAFKHDSVITNLLRKDGLTFPSKEGKIKKTMEKAYIEYIEVDVPSTTEDTKLSIKMESLEEKDASKKKPPRVPEAFSINQCQICLKEFQQHQSIRIHYISQHFSKMIPEDADSMESCSICSASIELRNGSLRYGMITHLAFLHWDILLKHMEEENLWVGKSKIFSLGENGYKIKKMKIDIKYTKELKLESDIVLAKKLRHEQMKKKKMLKRSFTTKIESQISLEKPEQMKKKKIIQATFLTKIDSQISPEKPSELKLPLEELMICFLCKKDFNNSGQNALLSHFSEEHYRLELEHNYITMPGMTWATDKKCPQCLKMVEKKQDFVYHIGVEHRAVQNFLPKKYQLSIVTEKELSFPCPLKNCSSDKETKKALLRHLYMEHYQTDMEKEFGALFKKQENKKCPKCNMTLLDNFIGYMKHIAVEHAYVMNFVERDLNGESINNDDNKSNKNPPIKVDLKINSRSDVVYGHENFVEQEDTNETSGPEIIKSVLNECVLNQQTPNKNNQPIVTGLTKIVMVNESKSRSAAPKSTTAESPAKENPIASFNLRAILDSDSDSDSV